jgi:hypothetical protein
VNQLAVGLGVGLTRSKAPSGGDELPSAGQDDSEAGMQESGLYFVSDVEVHRHAFRFTAC